jgi:hypothetical protein
VKKMGRIHYGGPQAPVIGGRQYHIVGAYTLKSEAQREAKSNIKSRWVRVVKRLSMPSMRGRNDYVWVVYASTSMKSITLGGRRK